MERIAEGVHLVRGGMPRVMNVYLIEDEGGVTVFDAGIRGMHKAILKAAGPLGGVKRLVLGHSHTDHRGAAPEIAATGVPIYCHEAELGDAEGDGGMHYFHLEQLRTPVRQFMRHSLLKTWDDGPTPIEGTLVEGDEIADFQVIHLPGHAPGLIGLYRERDGLVLSSDAIYTLNPLNGRKGPPRIPLGAFNMDTAMAQASALKLSALAPKTVWPGHADAMAEDVPAALDELGRKGGVLGKD
jgi:glyoxylase-like metal-dependent hydrolase (beta-lactamase superfamily II)